MFFPVVALDPSKLDEKLVETYFKNTKLLDALDEWVLNPDYSLLPRLYEMRDLINKLQPHRDARTKLYRGFSINGTMQNFFGLKANEDFKNPNKDFKITIENPTSFTTSLDIASGFGSCVISTTPGQNLKHFLRITDEVAAAVCRNRNIAPETQYEWVFLPIAPTEISIRFLKYAKPAWYKFW